MLRTSIQSKLIDEAMAGPFYEVTYNKDTGKPNPISTETSIVPVSCRCNETDSSFAEDKRHSAGLALARTDWNFMLRLTFQKEVTLEAFEEKLRKNPPYIPGVKATQQPHILLMIGKTTASHPVQHSPDSGTQATIAFKARLTRV